MTVAEKLKIYTRGDGRTLYAIAAPSRKSAADQLTEAAEAALAAERALLVRAKDHIVQYADDLSMHSPAAKLVEEIAAAIRAQGE